MGLLKDDRYWANVANEVFNLRPGPGVVMPGKNAVRVLEIACKALTDLSADPELESDLDAAVQAALAADPPHEPNQFHSFVAEFVRAEQDVLRNSGVNYDTTQKILAEVQQLSTGLTNNDIDRLSQKIDLCRRLACENRNTINPEEQKSRALIVVSVVGGITMISSDIAALAKSGGLMAKVAGPSIGFGIKIAAKAIFPRW